MGKAVWQEKVKHQAERTRGEQSKIGEERRRAKTWLQMQTAYRRVSVLEAVHGAALGLQVRFSVPRQLDRKLPKEKEPVSNIRW